MRACVIVRAVEFRRGGSSVSAPEKARDAASLASYTDRGATSTHMRLEDPPTTLPYREAFVKKTAREGVREVGMDGGREGEDERRKVEKVDW